MCSGVGMQLIFSPTCGRIPGESSRGVWGDVFHGEQTRKTYRRTPEHELWPWFIFQRCSAVRSARKPRRESKMVRWETRSESKSGYELLTGSVYFFIFLCLVFKSSSLLCWAKRKGILYPQGKREGAQHMAGSILTRGTQHGEVSAASHKLNLLGTWFYFINLLKLVFFYDQYFISVL